MAYYEVASPPWRVAVWVNELPGPPVEIERASVRPFAARPQSEGEASLAAVEVSRAHQPREWYGLVGGSYEPSPGDSLIVDLKCRRWADSFGLAEREAALEPFAHSGLLKDWYPRIAMGIYAAGEHGVHASVSSGIDQGTASSGLLTISHGATRPFKGSAHREATDVLLRVFGTPTTGSLEYTIEDLVDGWEERDMPPAPPW